MHAIGTQGPYIGARACQAEKSRALLGSSSK